MSSWKEYSSQKIIPPEQIETVIGRLKSQNKTIATLNGSFDLLHAGHMYMLYEASKRADILLLGVNSDASIKSYKSAQRPIIPLNYRLEMLSAIGFIDYISWFDEPDPRAFLQTVKPHIHVNGIEYGTECIESTLLKEMGTQLHLVDRIPGLATSEIIEKIEHACV
ncbi:MAG: Bifunctional protein HldE [Chlamydiales bacterium]|nr:Bifunctional protein HldE [Chlamydiales bacterium]